MDQEPAPSESQARRHKAESKALAVAMDGSFWSGLRWWQRVGVVLLWIGAAGLVGSLALITAFPWLPLSALACMVVGGAMLFAGATWARSENWPTHGD
jgi:hypothetical protein